MRKDLANRLRCAICCSENISSHSFKPNPSETNSLETIDNSLETINKGVVYCDQKHWYPIENGVLEFLAPELAYHADRSRFWSRYSTELAQLGLKATTDENSNISSGDQKEVLNQQQHFDWYAENDAQSYDEYSRMPFWEAVDSSTFERWRNFVEPSDLVLDIGCAQGRASIQLADKAPAVIGMDISKKLIHKAYQNFKQAGYRGKYDFLVADGSRPPFREAVFDCVLIYGVLHHLPSPSTTCQEVARILKPGGLFLSSENNQSAFRSVFDFLMKVSALWHEEAGPQPLLSRQDIAKWLQPTALRAKTSTIVFLPPHLINLLPRVVGRAALAITDAICKRVPFLRENGGLLVIEGQKATVFGDSNFGRAISLAK